MEELGEMGTTAVAQEKRVEARMPLVGVTPPARGTVGGQLMDAMSEGTP